MFLFVILIISDLWLTNYFILVITKNRHLSKNVDMERVISNSDHKKMFFYPNCFLDMAKKRFFHSNHRKPPFDRNVDIKRVMIKQQFFHSDHKKGNFARNVNSFRLVAKKRFFDSDHKKFMSSLLFVRIFNKLIFFYFKTII